MQHDSSQTTQGVYKGYYAGLKNPKNYRDKQVSNEYKF
jgi:hypothetical protein